MIMGHVSIAVEIVQETPETEDIWVKLLIVTHLLKQSRSKHPLTGDREFTSTSTR